MSAATPPGSGWSLGVLSRELRAGESRAAMEAAAELEGMGYSTVWMSGMDSASIFGRVAGLLDATERLTVATAVLAVSVFDVGTVVDQFRGIDKRRPNRFLVGLGGARSARPVSQLSRYLDELDRGETRIPRERRALGALGPRMLKLAADRTSGAFPCLITPEHTARARTILGRGFLAAHLPVVLERDPVRARAAARRNLNHMFGLPAYRANWRRVGFTDKDFENGASDDLIDAIVAWGDVEDVDRRVRALYAAGADQVVLQVFGAAPGSFPLRQWRLLADAIKIA